MSIFDIAELLLFFASFFAFGFYLYLAGKYKGFLEAISLSRMQRRRTRKG